MTCAQCQQGISDDARFCQFCGADQRRSASADRTALRRSRVDRQVAGICGGIARYLGADPVFVRLAWVVLTIVPGSIFFGVLAYAVAWLVMPEAEPGSEPMAAASGRRLERSVADAKVAGVCGGLAAYFAVDSTAVRLLWVILSIFPGFIVCGVLSYAAAWLIMPAAARPMAVTPPTPPSEPAPAAGAE